MRFTSQLDYNTWLKFNKEFVNTVVDTPIVIYKVNISETKINIYGEGTSKATYTGVQVPCLIDRKNARTDSDIGVVNVTQDISFAILRTTLEEKNIYPEIGDIAYFDSQFYEINTVNETQLIAGQTIYNHQIFCEAHLMRVVPTQLQATIL